MIKPALTVAVAVVFGLAACGHRHRLPPGPEADLAAIQKRLSEVEEGVDRLTQRVTMIQIMVDSHQQALQDLASSATPGGRDAADQTSPPPTGAEEAPPVSGTAQSESSPESREDQALRTPEAEERLTVPEPDPLYQEAMKTFRGGDYKTAAGLFEAFARQFPKNGLADNALYWSGECRYTQKDYTGALKQFRQVIEEYPSGSKVPDALLKIGFSYLALGDKESAVTYLKKVMVQYPFSTAGTKAEERLKTLQK